MSDELKNYVSIVKNIPFFYCESADPERGRRVHKYSIGQVALVSVDVGKHVKDEKEMILVKVLPGDNERFLKEIHKELSDRFQFVVESNDKLEFRIIFPDEEKPSDGQ